MNYKIDKGSDKSAYIQLYRQVRNDIENGVYKYGEKLPSKRILAEETGVSVITVMHAFDILCDEGYVESRERSGYFVCFSREDGVLFDSNEHILESVLSEKEIDENAELDVGRFPFSVYAKTMRSVLSDYSETIYEKSPSLGTPELRVAISEYLKKNRGMEVSPNRIVVGAGAEYLYGLVVQMLGRTRIYALEKPSYDKIYKVYKANGAKCEFLKLGENGIMSSELSRTSASVLHVTPFNSYPSGVTASASKRREYVSWAKENGAYIVEDDFDSEFTVSKKTADTLFSLNPESVIYINTFSETIAPSVRIGYMVVPENLIDAFDEKVGFYSCTVPVIDQLVIARIIESGDFERHINRVRRKRRKMLDNG